MTNGRILNQWRLRQLVIGLVIISALVLFYFHIFSGKTVDAVMKLNHYNTEQETLSNYMKGDLKPNTHVARDKLGQKEIRMNEGRVLTSKHTVEVGKQKTYNNEKKQTVKGMDQKISIHLNLVTNSHVINGSLNSVNEKISRSQKPIFNNKVLDAKDTKQRQSMMKYSSHDETDPWLRNPYIDAHAQYPNVSKRNHTDVNKTSRTSHKKIPRPQEIKDGAIDHMAFQSVGHSRLVNSLIRIPQNLTKEVFIFEVMRESKKERHSVKDSKCVLLHSHFVESPICIHDPDEDEVISATLLKQQTWEPNLLYVAGRILTNNRDMKFLDLGCNLGVYTIVAAKLGIDVVAVDPNKQNLRLLTKALSLGGIRNRVTMLWNAVSNVHENVTLNDIIGNIGGSFVETAGSQSDQDTTVQTIKLDDLIPFFKDTSVFIKIDIETYEWKALQGGEKFFETIDVAYILMEWSYHREHGDGPEIIEFMYKRGHYPHINANYNTQLERENYRSWPDNVLWIKYSNILVE